MVSHSSEPQVLLDPHAIVTVFRKLEAGNPHPQTELIYTTSYTLLVAVVLSAQSTDAAVNKATKALFCAADSADKMLALGLEPLKSYIRTLGLFNNKAKNIIALSEILVRDYRGEIPQSVEELETLPGVGRKTANVVANVLWQMPTMPVDTHVFRVANRLGLCQTRTPQATEKALLKVIPENLLVNAHHWLILHGRYICKARNPECARCPVADMCFYPNKTKESVGKCV